MIFQRLFVLTPAQTLWRHFGWVLLTDGVYLALQLRHLFGMLCVHRLRELVVQTLRGLPFTRLFVLHLKTSPLIIHPILYIVLF